MSWLASNWQWLVGLVVLHSGLRAIALAVAELRVQQAKDAEALRAGIGRMAEHYAGRVLMRLEHDSPVWHAFSDVLARALASRITSSAPPDRPRTE